MITYVVGDLFTSPAKVLVNTVNTVGVMGKGIALDFKRIYPEMFEQYQYYCENGMFDIGKLWLYKTSHKWILNFPTKEHWRNKSRIEYIEAGLEKFADTYDSKGIGSISFPMLGCGNGELDWNTQVQPVMEEYLRQLPLDIYIHLRLPDSPFVPEHRNVAAISNWLRSQPQHLPFTEFWDDIVALATSDRTYATLSTGTPFTVNWDSEDQALKFKSDGDKFSIRKESYEQFWTFIRPKGYFHTRDFPEEMTRHVLHVASFLQHLRYIRPILLSLQSNVTNRDIGLLLSAQPSDTDREPEMVQSA